MKKNKLLLLTGILLGCSLNNAQFTITNNFRTNDSSGLKLGDNATLTAASGVDPNGEGWLRLTNAATYQKGYMYILQSFPTDLGVLADFEYKAWRSSNDGYNGADGFSVFLFNGNVTEAEFKLGGFGGSLGYATYNNPAGTTGLSGGYIGVGFDEYGNFARANENRNGGTNVEVPNSVVLRGPTSATYNLSNPYFAHTALGDRTGTLAQIRNRNEIDYNTITPTRPTDNQFYRRFQLEVKRVGADYQVNVKWRKQGETTFTEIITHTINSATYPIPPTLKVGFAGSTGGGYNFHEIRNILLTTPGNIRVDSRSDMAILCNDKKTRVTLNIEVTNDTPIALSNINFSNEIQNSAGTLLNTSQFKITSLSTTGFSASNLPTTSFPTNRVSGKVGLPANRSGIVTITGEYYPKALKNNESFKSVTIVDTSEVTDTDNSNNSATSVIAVRKCNFITNPSLPSYNK
ncbi:lectin-like domain-containing protein [Chryseobacterium sp. VAUSW3]|uniref:lectin-like domain-containing protein n=1 Tax=Chryseobacterium sp. VAUSW3 TaxID=2010998 RepID=UPI000B4C4FF3|nr:hypothetical protein [Chryseobacterium sp. VAUSW3]OWR12996.1 hypothetical protein CDW55_11535 [Chryseobacterium sp. VAUSW3]